MGNEVFHLETQSWMCKNVYVDTLWKRLRKLSEDWTIYDGVLHHDTCPTIDGDAVKGAWSFPMAMSNCSCCGIAIPEAILMIAKLQMLKGERDPASRQRAKARSYATMYGASSAVIQELVENDID